MRSSSPESVSVFRETAGWVPLATLSKVATSTPAPVSVMVSGVRWAVTLLDGDVVALRDICPHRRVPLSAGRVTVGPGRQILECGYHGWSFDSAGTCVRIPALGENVVPRGMRSVDTMATVVAGMCVWGCPDPDPGPMPDIGDGERVADESVVDGDVENVSSLIGVAQAGAPGLSWLWQGVDEHGHYSCALRPTDAGRVAVFPIVATNDESDADAGWHDRFARLDSGTSISNEVDQC